MPLRAVPAILAAALGAGACTSGSASIPTSPPTPPPTGFVPPDGIAISGPCCGSVYAAADAGAWVYCDDGAWAYTTYGVDFNPAAGWTAYSGKGNGCEDAGISAGAAR